MKRALLLFAAFVSLTTVALAQERAPSPSQLAVGISQAVAQMSQTIDRQASEIDALKKQLKAQSEKPPVDPSAKK